MNWRDHITGDPGICRGKACIADIADTRVVVTAVLNNVASGLDCLDSEEITRSHPSVSREPVEAALSYAAGLANDRMFRCSNSSPWNKVVGGLTPVEGVRIRKCNMGFEPASGFSSSRRLKMKHGPFQPHTRLRRFQQPRQSPIRP